MPMEMDVNARAVAVLEDAEAQLRVLIDDSLAAQRYEDVASIAALARQLVSIKIGHDVEMPANSAGDRADALLESKLISSTDSTHKTNGAYPRFEREANRLVKIGWSKKDRRVYEHKTPFEAVLAVCEALQTKKGKFVMDEILPLKYGHNWDVPSYQAYLVLAWLRQLGLVVRNGNDGYTANPAGLSKEMINEQLQSLPAR